MSMLRVLSLGAGVQSTTLALMAAHGEIGPMPGHDRHEQRAARGSGEMTQRICPECGGDKVIEYESLFPVATPEGPRWQYYRDPCSTCRGTGSIKVYPVEMEDICDDDT
jgi:DnaJ-class molecular chaperone